MEENRQQDRLFVRFKKGFDILGKFDPKLTAIDFLKKEFKANPNFGSKDRKFYTDLMISHIKTKEIFDSTLSFEEKVVLGYWLAYGLHVPATLISKYTIPNDIEEVDKRYDLLKSYGIAINFEKGFPHFSAISPQIDSHKLLLENLKKPMVWLRAKKKRLLEVKEEFDAMGIDVYKINELETAFGLEKNPDFSLMQCFKKGWFEVQDLSSQKAIVTANPLAGERWIDTCSGSGGKALALLDMENKIDLTVCDKRASILRNLEDRFKRSGTANVLSIQVDFTDELQVKNIGKPKFFNAAVIDVPCSGSGTWSRNPEWYMKENEIDLNAFAKKQFEITKNVHSLLFRSGKAIYITCSVYKEENEDVLDRLESEKLFKIESARYVKGYGHLADTLFVAELTVI